MFKNIVITFGLEKENLYFCSRFHLRILNHLLTYNPIKMRKNICLMTMALAVAMLFFACHNEKYTITVNVNDPAMGTVTGGGEFKGNTQISIEAKANEGYTFVSWSDGNTDNPRKVVVTANASYTAMFKPLGATISFNGESWTAQSFICDNITGNYLPIYLYKTAGDQNDVYLRGSMMKAPGSYTYETSDGDFFSYLDPNHTYTDEDGILGGNPGDTYYYWQVDKNSFVETVEDVDLNTKTISATWSENAFNIDDFIASSGQPTSFYPITCEMIKAEWEWNNATKQAPLQFSAKGLLKVQ